MNETRQPSMLVPALIGGGVAGFVSSIPGLNLLNCACCSLVIGGGLLAAFLQSKNCRQAGAPFSAGSGALVGLVSAVAFAVTVTVVGTLIRLITPTGDPAQMLAMFREQGVEVPPVIETFLQGMSGGPGFALWLGVGFLLNLVVGAIFSPIGGLLGGMIFRYEPAPSGPPPAPPAGV